MNGESRDERNMDMTKQIDLTVAEAERYAPYHTFPEFAVGYNDHMIDKLADYEGVAGQAYARGAECAMRRGLNRVALRAGCIVHHGAVYIRY
jgi:hypothetical protein